MNIVFAYSDSPEDWNCSEWRCAVPARAINRTKRHRAELISLADFAYNSSSAINICDQADIIVVECHLIGPVLSSIQYWKARDKAVIVDFNSAFNLLPISDPKYNYWFRGINSSNNYYPINIPERVNPPPFTQFKLGLGLVHAATVPSRRMVDDWKDLTFVYHLPNYIDLEMYQNVSLKPHQGVNIGWGGSISYYSSFKNSGLIDALIRVCEQRPEVKIIIASGNRYIYDHLPIPERQKELVPKVSNSSWPQVLSQFDIGLAPLFGPYDERRSYVKLLEYMIMKIPWVASESSAFSELRDYGWLVGNNPDSWVSVLLDLVDNLQEYKVEASRLPYLFGISQSIDENVNKLITIYQDVINKALN